VSVCVSVCVGRGRQLWKLAELTLLPFGPRGPKEHAIDLGPDLQNIL